jgi:hypothetical protein
MVAVFLSAETNTLEEAAVARTGTAIGLSVAPMHSAVADGVN